MFRSFQQLLLWFLWLWSLMQKSAYRRSVMIFFVFVSDEVQLPNRFLFVCVSTYIYLSLPLTVVLQWPPGDDPSVRWVAGRDQSASLLCEPYSSLVGHFLTLHTVSVRRRVDRLHLFSGRGPASPSPTAFSWRWCLVIQWRNNGHSGRLCRWTHSGI